MAVVWCPDWPVVSWGVPLDEPAAVLVANRVVATSPAARDDGVRVGQRRREAQSRCPQLALLNRDVDRENRLFEPVVASLDAITPRVEVAGAGLVGFPTRGPARFFGGEESLTEAVMEAVRPNLGRHGRIRVAMADGVFAARLAARCRIDDSAGHPHRKGVIRIVPAGESRRFLTPLPITALEMPDLTDVLIRLGLETLGQFADLSTADVVDRFGRDGRLAHRLARGLDDHPPDLRHPAPDLAVSWTFDPPADRVERCVFVIKSLADELHANLDSRGMSCTRVAIEAETETGERQLRYWRHQGTLSAAAVADRARWQLDGWLTSRSLAAAAGPKSGVLRLTIVPDEVVPAVGRQLGFWGGDRGRTDDVTRVVARLQTVLGADAVTVPEFRGGLSAAEQIRLIPAAAVDLTEDRPATRSDWNREPWPGQVPAPSPLSVHPDALPIELHDEQGEPVGVTGR
ncbi:MAG: DNA polymerase Y family protein, partial [Acidimicrobiia bacterium]|nr:DNA polymerase Y family protein [Acidimicrobiia bacterium]